jgi:hypothetical protein
MNAWGGRVLGPLRRWVAISRSCCVFRRRVTDCSFANSPRDRRDDGWRERSNFPRVGMRSAIATATFRCPGSTRPDRLLDDQMLVHVVDVVAPNAIECRTDCPDASIEVPAADAESELIAARWELIQLGLRR